MLIRARDQQGKLVTASYASTGIDYYCCECNGVLRRRGGRAGRKAHFFHLTISRSCRQSAKSERHIRVQEYFERLLGSAVELERRFPEISRIADVAWEAEKIIFEVQVSGISGEEVLARNRDYASLGWRVVWILHDVRYNGRRFSEAEEVLREALYYYTNMNAEGVGEIYHQRVCWQESRVVRSRRVFPDVTQPLRAPVFCFVGDLEYERSGDRELDRQLSAMERKKRQGFLRGITSVSTRVKRLYRLLLYAYLEKIS